MNGTPPRRLFPALAPMVGLFLFPSLVNAQAPDTVRFTPEVAQPTFAVREPVLTLRPGTVLVSETNWGPYFSPEGGAFPGEVGPIYVEGATTNDILVVKVHKVRPNPTEAP